MVNKKAKVIALSALCGFFALVIVLVVVESLMGNRYKFTNKTDKNITALTVFFEDDEGEYSTQIFDGTLDKGKTESGKFETIDCSRVDRSFYAFVEFEGEEEVMVYDGFFIGQFNGSVSLEFYQENGEYRLKTDASTGLFGNSDDSGMDSVIYFDFENADWDYIS
ncbi:MAG: hypothetical protein MJ131_00895 [Lachnospiraceae bacterium]|nr:hypothetical protein [Lachnospiraceae bacterium]